MGDENSTGERKLVKETDKVYIYLDADGTKIYKCKFCGKEFTKLNELARHFSEQGGDRCPNYEEYLKVARKDKKKKRSYEGEEDESVKRRERYKPLTPEEEMLEEMANTLEDQLRMAPGIHDEKRIEWAVEYFRRTERLQEDPKALFQFLLKTFPKIDNDVADFIVTEVFRVRDEYNKNRAVMGYTPSYRNRGLGNYPSYTPPTPSPYPPPTSGSGSDVKDQLLIMLFNEVLSQRHETSPQKSEEQIRKELEMEMILKSQQQMIESLQAQINQLVEAIRSGALSRPQVSPEGWKDDYARAFTEVGTKIVESAQMVIAENKKTRRILYQILLSQSGAGKPVGEGKTEKEIVEELPEELVEEGE